MTHCYCSGCGSSYDVGSAGILCLCGASIVAPYTPSAPLGDGIVCLIGPGATDLLALLSNGRHVSAAGTLPPQVLPGYDYFFVEKSSLANKSLGEQMHEAKSAYWAAVRKENNMSQVKLALAYIANADLYRQRSELEASVQNYTQAINIYKEMAEGEPAMWDLVAQTIETVSATYKAAGKLDQAQEAMGEALKLRETIARLKRRQTEEEG